MAELSVLEEIVEVVDTSEDSATKNRSIVGVIVWS